MHQLRDRQSKGELRNTNELPPELIEKAKACHTPEEFHTLAKETGMEIPDEALEAVAGGAWCSDHEWGCPGDGCGNYRGI